MDADKLQDVLSLGYCRDVVDIFNDVSLEARPNYIAAYRPASSWQLVAARPMEMFHITTMPYLAKLMRLASFFLNVPRPHKSS